MLIASAFESEGEKRIARRMKRMAESGQPKGPNEHEQVGCLLGHVP